MQQEAIWPTSRARGGCHKYECCSHCWPGGPSKRGTQFFSFFYQFSENFTQCVLFISTLNFSLTYPHFSTVFKPLDSEEILFLAPALLPFIGWLHSLGCTIYSLCSVGPLSAEMLFLYHLTGRKWLSLPCAYFQVYWRKPKRRLRISPH